MPDSITSDAMAASFGVVVGRILISSVVGGVLLRAVVALFNKLIVQNGTTIPEPIYGRAIGIALLINAAILIASAASGVAGILVLIVPPIVLAKLLPTTILRAIVVGVIYVAVGVFFLAMFSVLGDQARR